jgi:hypothetical protein
LRWEDFDEEKQILRVRRRQLRGRLGRVTLSKRAPKEYPVSPELMAILVEHRGGNHSFTFVDLSRAVLSPRTRRISGRAFEWAGEVGYLKEREITVWRPL